MNYTSAALLEFPELLALVSRFVASPQGQAALAGVAPTADRAALEHTLAETAEAIEYLESASRPQPAARGAAIRLRFDGLPDCSGARARLAVEGAVLEAKEILDLTALLDRTSDMRAILTAAARRFPRLAGIGERIGEFRPLLGEMTGRIEPDGTIADRASPELARLRREIERQHRHIQESLERFLRLHREDGVLQEEFVTLRNDRFVVPIVPGQRRRVVGVIHASSGSGHTLFLEPLETIEQNNELVRLRQEEMREEWRILSAMTKALRSRAAEIASTLDAAGALDLLFAKGQFAIDFGCVVPRLSDPERPRLLLREARHPLLEDLLRRRRRGVVPFSFTLETPARTLLVTGPNTGGKTVTLKTTGLLALMAQAGLPVPAAEAEFPVFDQILADIGDNQSIQESLSTFSAHITRVREIIERATPGSLVLLDELGRATDPEEGGPLGVAVLDSFRRTGAFTLASTHLVALKSYAATTPGAILAAMGFDERTLEPTYLLQIGAPGKSAGLEIAARLGLPDSLLRQARASMSDAQRRLGDLQRMLEERLTAAAALEEELRRQREALEEERSRLARKWEEREAARIGELERRAASLLENFQARAREVIARIEQDTATRKFAAKASRRVAEASREFRAELDVSILPEKHGTSPEAASPVTHLLAPGTRLRLRGIREPARFRRRLNDGSLEVEAGYLKMRVPDEDVLEILPETAAPVSARAITVRAAGPAREASREINVIGRRAEEACAEVDKFLDTAVMASLEQVRIVHGHGMGVLKKAIAGLLGKHPHVKKFYPAPQQEGGTGATIVEILDG